MEKHEHSPDYRPSISALVAHVRDDHGPEVGTEFAERAGGLARGHRAAHPEIWGEQPMRRELDRAVWLLMQTDDYQVTGRGENWAELHYVHNVPPHLVTRIEVLQAGQRAEQ